MVMGVRGRARVAGEANGRGERGCGSGSVGDGVMLGCDRELGGSAAGGESRRWWETTFTWRPEYYWWWTMVETPLLYYALLRHQVACGKLGDDGDLLFWPGDLVEESCLC